MRSLVQAYQPGPVDFMGRTYWIDPPTTAQAFALTGLIRPPEEIGEGEAFTVPPDDAALLRKVVRDWLPVRMASIACRPGHLPKMLKLAQVLVEARQQDRLREVVGQDDEDGEPDEDAPGDDDVLRLLDFDWESLLSDFLGVYGGYTASSAMQEKWPLFLSLCGNVRRQQTRPWWYYLRAKSLPYIDDDRKRKKAFKSFREEAGIETDAEEPAGSAEAREQSKTPSTPEEQFSRLDDLFGGGIA